MYAKTYGETVCGINGEEITVEVDISNGLPGFDIVGLPDTAVKESRERVRAALKNSGLIFPMTRITVNLAPADLRKDGSSLDLPIAVGILTAAGNLLQEETGGKIFVGELALDGSIRQVTGVLPMILYAREHGWSEIYIPQGNASEGELVDGIDVYTPQSLGELVSHLKRQERLQPLAKKQLNADSANAYEVDFAEVRGQQVVKRALEIAAAGGHNVLMVGAPGSGKTMLARSLPTILPPMTEDEILEVTKIYSIAGLLNGKKQIVLERPFRSPHHTVSASALIGGGSVPRPGEVTLSHNGVLFLDELPEFSRATLEVLRQPLEDGVVTISRVQASMSFPAQIVMVAAQNPCPCGFLGDRLHECTCKPHEIERYKRKISGPLLDRIDIQVSVPRLEYDDLKGKSAGESSAEIRSRVVKARDIQRKRFEGSGVHCNAQMNKKQLNKYCKMEPQAEAMLGKYFTALGLSARTHDRIIKVASTIADLAGAEKISAAHIAEAIQLRTSLQR